MKLKRRINTEVERKLKDVYFVGRLATKDDLAGTHIVEPVYYKGEINNVHSEDIQFHIQCLSPIPEALSDYFYFPNNIITASTISNNNYRKLNAWMDYDRIFFVDRKDKVREFLENKLIVFSITVRPEYIYAELYQVENIEPYEKGYTLIPGPRLNLDENKTDFEKKMVEVRRPITLHNHPNIFELPEFIYYKGTIYEVSLNASQNATTYYQNDSQEVDYYQDSDNKFMEYVDARIDDELYFVQSDKIFDIRDIIQERGKSLNEKFEYEKAMEDRQEKEEKEKQFDTIKTTQLVKPTYNKTEIDFINRLKENARRRGLYYKEEDLYAFHISVKTNLLTIIGGMSGTGKSQLAKLYGETMGLEYGKELLMIPVSPSYHEPNDVLGYLNPTTGVYYESETGLVSLLLDAAESPEKMFMVIFDEMNLSQVEHWFSPFISILEIEEENRYLTLFNKNSFCVNSNYEPRIRVGNNIIFVGTVNFDETAKDFSDRLLDRINVIEPTKLSFKDSIQILRTQQERCGDIEPLSVHTKIFREDWVTMDKTSACLSVLTNDEIEVLDRLHHLLHKDDRQRGVSFRVALGISTFIANIPVTKDQQYLVNRSIAFDIQLSQRILTKIKGLESYVGPLVGRFQDEEYIPGQITHLLISEGAKQVSDFQISLKILKGKARELMMYGYAK